MTAPLVSTYSMWSLFRNCRKAVDWRYLQQLVPLERDRNLHFGIAHPRVPRGVAPAPRPRARCWTLIGTPVPQPAAG